jgi:rhodanese-related sulfurtransferase
MKIFLSLLLLSLTSNMFAAFEPQKAYSMVREGKAVFVDVREKDEIKNGMIDRAIWFPKSRMNSDTAWKEDFKAVTMGKKIFLYCRSGKRSEECQKILQKNGVESESIGGYEQLKTMLPISIPKG